MKRKHYINPIVKTDVLNTSYLMATVSESEVPSIGFAPARRTQVF